MKTRKVLPIVFAALAAVVIAVSFMDFFDPVEYIGSVLDLVYKNEAENYKKLVNATDEEASDMYARNLSCAMETFSGLGLSDEMNGKYRSVVSDLMKNVRYKVGEAEKQKGGGYIVRVTINPLTIFQDTAPLLQEKSREYATELSNEVMAGTPMPSEKEIRDRIYEMYYSLLNEHIADGIKYGKAQTLFIHIDRIKHRVYQIRPQDLDMLAYRLLSPKVVI